VEPVPPPETPPGIAEPVESLTHVPASAKRLTEIVIPAGGSTSPGADAVADPAPSASDDALTDFGRAAFAALVQSQTALARGLGVLSAELAGLALSGIDAAARTASDLLAVKTLCDAIEVNAAFTRSSFETLVGGSAKLSELGSKLAVEASQPILTQLGRGWVRAARVAF
jgi:hypothetical protein